MAAHGIVDQSARTVARSLGAQFAFGTVQGWLMIAVGLTVPPLIAASQLGAKNGLWLAALGVMGGLAVIGLSFLVSLVVAPLHQRNEARKLLSEYRADPASRAIERLQEFVIDRGGADLDALRCLTARDMYFGSGMSAEAFRFLLYQKGIEGDESLALSVLGYMATVGVVKSETRGGILVFVLTDLGVSVLERLRLPRRGVLAKGT